MKPLLYLSLRRLVNALKGVPRNPRLLVPLLLFALVLGLQIFAFVLIGGERAAAMSPPLPTAWTPAEFIEGGPGVLRAAIRGVLLLSVFTALVGALGEGNLFFDQSDVDFLFPAPLARRAVLLFKMAGRYAGLLFPAFYVPLVVGQTAARQAGLSPLAAFWPGILGAWLFLVATTNTTQAILLARADQIDDPSASQTRERTRRLLTGLRYALLFAVAYIIYKAAVGDDGSFAGLRGLLRVLNGPVVSLLLLPIAWASDLFLVAFSGWSVATMGELLALLALCAGSFVLLFSRDRDFYEAALDVSARRLRTVSAVQSGDAGAILSQLARDGKLARGRSLRPFGSGALALLWKDLIGTTRTPLRSWITLLVIAGFPALFGRIVPERQSAAGLIFWLLLFIVNMSSLFLLPLRDMLRRADITKALPLSPVRVLLAESALSVAQLSLLGWVSLGIQAVVGRGEQRGPLALVTFLSLPSLAAALLFVQTCFVLLYPHRRDPAQSAVAGVLSVLVSLLAVVPTLVVGVALFLGRAGAWLLVAGISLANLVVAGAALAFATFLWQRFDPTD